MACSKLQQERVLPVSYHYRESVEDPKRNHATHCAKAAMEPLGSLLSQRSKDLFRMKVLSLLEKHGIASNPEARDQVRHTPIQGNNGKEQNKYTLTQRLSLFPGQTIIVEGDTAFNAKTQVIDQIFPGTFSISFVSEQTGYPHPSQRAGWTLAHSLIPASIQRRDLLADLGEIFAKKEAIKTRLQPQGDLIGKAKALLRLKKKVFCEHQEEMLYLHQRLSLAILEACNQPTLSAQKHVVDEWYQNLRGQKQAFDIIHTQNDEWSEGVVTKAFQIIQEAIIQGKNTPVGSSDPLTRASAIEYLIVNVLEQVQRERGEAASKYFQLYAEIFKPAVSSIIRQYLSEDLVYPAPRLNAFEKKVQQALYTHINDFVSELIEFDSLGHTNLNSWCYKKMKQFLESDIALFSGKERLNYADNLEKYYQTRYATLSASLHTLPEHQSFFAYSLPIVD